MLSRLTKKGQSGQSLVILAIGFLALLGFVGIVTDISVLFIRYNTMRRAVDAAAIAAAGQMRRIPDTMLDDTVPVADGQATSIANLNLAARQFIQVYGLNPKTVIVETCRAQQVARNSAGVAVDAAGHPIMVDVTTTVGTVTTTKSEPNVGQVVGIPAADPATVAKYRELCTDDELKLVRVTTQIDAPTIFLRLLGYPTVTLTESAVSQTAVIDVVLIFDVSESMLNETTYADWDTLPDKQGVRYMPPYVSYYDYSGGRDTFTPPYDSAWMFINDNNQANLNAAIAPDPTGVLGPPNEFIDDRTVAFEPDGSGGWQEFPYDPDPNNPVTSTQGRVQPRAFCRVRAYPGTVLQSETVPSWLRTEYGQFFNGAYSGGGSNVRKNYAAQFTPGQDIIFNNTFYGFPQPGSEDPANPVYYMGFVPMYNYFGCCNDPNGDWYFTDLVCQPFKQARDAAHQFLDRLDFLRGDRVAFVTFDRRATVIDPDGETNSNPDGDTTTDDSVIGGSQAHMIETQSDIPVDPSDPSAGLLRKGADNTLDDAIGVRAEMSSYADVGTGHVADGVWDHLRDHTNAVDYNYFLTTPIGSLFDHPVNGSCPFTDAVIPPEFLSNARRALDTSGSPELRSYSHELLRDIITVPDWYYAIPGVDGYKSIYRNYEYRASCSGTNIGEALQAGSGALYNEARREGAVWIMVLLSDGAAGASNPITRYHDDPIYPADPFEGTTGLVIPQAGLGGPDVSDPIPPADAAGGYGVFGLCPYGTQAQPSQLVQNKGTDYFPACGDLNPATRHFCGIVSNTPDAQYNWPDPVAYDPACFSYYNVDDYARDWADWVGIATLPGAPTGGVTGRITSQLLPTIFSIGFGLNFDNGICATGNYDCQRGLETLDPSATLAQKREIRDRNADYLGEELLRYIADVGDNNQLDSDYWQTCMSGGKAMQGGVSNCRDDGGLALTTDPARIENAIDLTLPTPNWGPRGACQTDAYTPGAFGRGSALDPQIPRQACGNYYVAATQQELEEVFNQIASRMFTRLSQ